MVHENIPFIAYEKFMNEKKKYGNFPPACAIPRQNKIRKIRKEKKEENSNGKSFSFEPAEEPNTFFNIDYDYDNHKK